MLWFRNPEKVYFKKGCMPVALSELKDVYGKKRAFVVTDSFLYMNGYTKPITDKLDEMGIVYTVFSDVQPDPTLANAQAGAKAMRAFQPDTIIALGGGSAMDAAKIMWVMYEFTPSRRWVRKHTLSRSRPLPVLVPRLPPSQLSQTRIQALNIRWLTTN